MGSIYDIVVLGEPSDGQLQDVRTGLESALKSFGLDVPSDVRWIVKPSPPSFDERRSSAAVFFGKPGAPEPELDDALTKGVPVLPVASTAAAVGAEIPASLLHLNAVDYSAVGPERVVSALLEALALLPRQRRAFLSYRRDEARAAALQLFDGLAARVFDVFLDTRGVPPGDDFQSVLWHRLCDCDVLVMLDTQTYFQSRWTTAEFGRALAKGIPILRIGWPAASASPRTATCSHLILDAAEIDGGSGRLTPDVVERICDQVEALRSRSHAVRRLNMLSGLRESLRRIGGELAAAGASGVVGATLPSGISLSVYAALGVPTSETIHAAEMAATSQEAVVAFDHVGLQPEWLEHLDWLGTHVTSTKCLKVSEATWRFAAWGT